MFVYNCRLVSFLTDSRSQHVREINVGIFINQSTVNKYVKRFLINSTNSQIEAVDLTLS